MALPLLAKETGTVTSSPGLTFVALPIFTAGPAWVTATTAGPCALRSGGMGLAKTAEEPLSPLNIQNKQMSEQMIETR